MKKNRATEGAERSFRGVLRQIKKRPQGLFFICPGGGNRTPGVGEKVPSPFYAALAAE